MYHSESLIHCCNNLSQSVLSQPGSYELKLVVTDDDGDTDEFLLSLTLKQDSEIKEDASFSAIIVGSISIIVILILISLIFTVKKSNGDFKLPKWKN